MDVHLELRDVSVNEEALAAEMTPRLVRLHSRMTREIADLAVVYAPNDTGELDRSIREDAQMVMPMRVTGGVTAHARHAIYVHEGTRPHVIHTDKDHPMVFRIGGMKIFAETVRSPGQRPNPFLRRAMQEVAAKTVETG